MDYIDILLCYTDMFPISSPILGIQQSLLVRDGCLGFLKPVSNFCRFATKFEVQSLSIVLFGIQHDTVNTTVR